MSRKPKTNHTAAGPGHNSLNKAKLKELVSRIEAIEEERLQLAGDVRDVYAEAKGAGFDVAAIRTIIKMRQTDKTEAPGRPSWMNISRRSVTTAARR